MCAARDTILYEYTYIYISYISISFIASKYVYSVYHTHSLIKLLFLLESIPHYFANYVYVVFAKQKRGSLSLCLSLSFSNSSNWVSRSLELTPVKRLYAKEVARNPCVFPFKSVDKFAISSPWILARRCRERAT